MKRESEGRQSAYMEDTEFVLVSNAWGSNNQGICNHVTRDDVTNSFAIALLNKNK